MKVLLIQFLYFLQNNNAWLAKTSLLKDFFKHLNKFLLILAVKIWDFQGKLLKLFAIFLGFLVDSCC